MHSADVNLCHSCGFLCVQVARKWAPLLCFLPKDFHLRGHVVLAETPGLVDFFLSSYERTYFLSCSRQTTELQSLNGSSYAEVFRVSGMGHRFLLSSFLIFLVLSEEVVASHSKWMLNWMDWDLGCALLWDIEQTLVWYWGSQRYLSQTPFMFKDQDFHNPPKNSMSSNCIRKSRKVWFFFFRLSAKNLLLLHDQFCWSRSFPKK